MLFVSFDRRRKTRGGGAESEEGAPAPSVPCRRGPDFAGRNQGSCSGPPPCRRPRALEAVGLGPRGQKVNTGLPWGDIWKSLVDTEAAGFRDFYFNDKTLPATPSMSTKEHSKLNAGCKDSKTPVPPNSDIERPQESKFLSAPSSN